MTIYTSKSGSWFDAGTEATLVAGPYVFYDDIELSNDNPIALFRGMRNGKEIEDICKMAEFDITT